MDTVPILSPYDGLIALRVVHGDGHWTPFSHLMAGVAVGDAILEMRGAVPTPDVSEWPAVSVAAGGAGTRRHPGRSHEPERGHSWKMVTCHAASDSSQR